RAHTSSGLTRCAVATASLLNSAKTTPAIRQNATATELPNRLEITNPSSVPQDGFCSATRTPQRNPRLCRLHGCSEPTSGPRISRPGRPPGEWHLGPCALDTRWSLAPSRPVDDPKREVQAPPSNVPTPSAPPEWPQRARPRSHGRNSGEGSKPDTPI